MLYEFCFTNIFKYTKIKGYIEDAQEAEAMRQSILKEAFEGRL